MGKTDKVFMMDIEQGMYVIELNNSEFRMGAEKFQLFLASKDGLLFFKGINYLCMKIKTFI